MEVVRKSLEIWRIHHRDNVPHFMCPDTILGHEFLSSWKGIDNEAHEQMG